MTIAPLTPLDYEGLGLCGPPQDFAIGTFHCKSQGSGKSEKLIFQAPPAFWRAPPGELLMLTGCNGKTWGSTTSVPERHEVQMSPLDTFVKLHATNGVPVLLEYAFALCSPDTWPFPSTMDLNILPKACLTYDTSADSENVPQDPAITKPDTNAGSGKSIAGTRAKARPSPKVLGPLVLPSKRVLDARTGNWKPWINETLAKQVAQDLHLSSDESDSENPEETNKDTKTQKRPIQHGRCWQLIEFRKINGDVLSPPMAHEGEKLMENL